jgi:hypothetical protein
MILFFGKNATVANRRDGYEKSRYCLLSLAPLAEMLYPQEALPFKVFFLWLEIFS